MKRIINICGMPATVEQLTRDLAIMYATGRITHDDYLTIWADLVDTVIPHPQKTA